MSFIGDSTKNTQFGLPEGAGQTQPFFNRLHQAYISSSLGSVMTSRSVPAIPSLEPPLISGNVPAPERRMEDIPAFLTQNGGPSIVPDFLKDRLIVNNSFVYSASRALPTTSAALKDTLYWLPRSLEAAGCRLSQQHNPPFLYVLLNSGKELSVLLSILSEIWRGPDWTMEWPLVFESLARPIAVPIGLVIKPNWFSYEVRSIALTASDLRQELINEAIDAHAPVVGAQRIANEAVTMPSLFIGLPFLQGQDILLNQPLAIPDFATYEMAWMMSRYVYRVMERSARRNTFASGAFSEDGQRHDSINRVLTYSLSTKRTATVTFPRTDIWALEIRHITQTAEDAPLAELSCGRLYEAYLRNLGSRISAFDAQVQNEIFTGIEKRGI